MEGVEHAVRKTAKDARARRMEEVRRRMGGDLSGEVSAARIKDYRRIESASGIIVRGRLSKSDSSSRENRPTKEKNSERLRENGEHLNSLSLRSRNCGIGGLRNNVIARIADKPITRRIITMRAGSNSVKVIALRTLNRMKVIHLEALAIAEWIRVV